MPLVEIPDLPKRHNWGDVKRFGRKHRGGGAFSRPPGDINPNLPDALFGISDPTYLIKHEKPVHRTMVEMSIKGFSNRDIAMFTGYSEQYVSNVIKQPGAQVRIVEQLKKNVQEELRDILEAEAVPTIKRLVGLRDQSVNPTVAKGACDSLLDRFLGKPTQPFVQNSKPVAEMSLDELRQQVSGIIERIPPSNGDSQQS